MDISDEKIKHLSYKHYTDWLNLTNEEDSPKNWLYGSFATVRGLMRIPYDDGHPEITRELLSILKKDIEEFEISLNRVLEVRVEY